MKKKEHNCLNFCVKSQLKLNRKNEITIEFPKGEGKSEKRFKREVSPQSYWSRHRSPMGGVLKELRSTYTSFLGGVGSTATPEMGPVYSSDLSTEAQQEFLKYTAQNN
ncbi:hypothetical protein TNCV_5132381 [Trichonephila clavipes]|nr:hypothetical protein TNCV_5132381 [Trichonephila clavipes]